MQDEGTSDQSRPRSAFFRHPPGYRKRRGRNWFFLGLTYASYYLCRYNLGIVAPELKEALGFSNKQYGAIDSARNLAYGVGQFVNGLFTDRIGGKQAMTIGALGTVLLNVMFGIVAWSNIGWLFFTLLIIRMADGYVQAFGAPGFIKINTAWFRRQERGTFSGVFGIMINLGRMGVGQLGPLLATGFAVPLIFFTLTVPKLDWRYMFIIPPVIVVIIILLMNLMVKNHPEEAGYSIAHDDEDPDDDPHERLELGVVFRKIASNPIVWIVACAYFCTGFVRIAISSWWTIYLDEAWNIGRSDSLFWWLAVVLLPWGASASSLSSGFISDKFFGGRRAPVAAVLYFAQFVFMVLSMMLAEGLFAGGAVMAIVLLLGIDMSCNATHSILGSAAAMDIGGRKMAGFSSGVIDSFQYFGATIAGVGLGTLLDAFAISAAQTTEAAASQPTALMNPTVWFASMAPFGLLGVAMMSYLWWRHGKSGKAGT